ncbi:MAG: LLM class F420-dependent oxidoreductase [bacterium]|nr:LLM class F420-dependent oxidoreductase [bacterium]
MVALSVMSPDYGSRYPYDPNGRSPFHEAVVQPDPLIWLAYVAAATRKLRLATGILILPQRNPVVLAKMLASLDRLSGGRMLLGVGVGWVREEAEAVGTRFEDRGRRTDEYIEAMRALWRSPHSSFAGETVRFEGVVSRPKPVQPGGVPIHIGGHSPAAARRAGRIGDGFYPLGVGGEELSRLLKVLAETAREHGRDPGAIEITCVGTLEPEVARGYQRVGVDRMTISPPTGDLAELRPILERFRREVIEPLST